MSGTPDCIIAIDFGTAYCSYAFGLLSSRREIDPNIKCWSNQYGEDTSKTLSCILFNKDKVFMAFGYDAITTYNNMDKDKKKKNYFFENFKMELYGKKLSRDEMITAKNGKSMEALTVFKEALRFLKDDALTTIAKQAKRNFTASDITWVLTVPAIWNQSAKQFMREAAIQAGIVKSETQNNLIMAPESEAASVGCKMLQGDGFITQKHDEGSLGQSLGTRYIVAACGVGTIDITVHEVCEGGALKELYKASGNDLGVQSVERKFKEFLAEIFSNGVWDEYEKGFPSEVQEIMQSFMYATDRNDDVTIECSYNLGELAQKRQEIEKFFKPVRGASWDNGNIKIFKEKITSFFAESLRGIKKLLSEVLDKQTNIKYIVLVGGYAKSQILRQYVNKNFKDECKILHPYRPQDVILKGAVMLGRNPAIVLSRKYAFTYGFADSEKFVSNQHKNEKKFVVQGEEFCRDIFRKLVEVDEDVGWDETRALPFKVVEANEKHEVTIKFYRTKKRNPLYVDEEGVEEVGSLEVPMPTTDSKMKEVKIDIKFSTEITAICTGLAYGPERRINFMSRK